MSTVSIPLRSRKYKGLYALIDDEDLAIISCFHIWAVHAHPKAGLYYAVARHSDSQGKTRDVLMHRLILGASQTEWVDHANHNGLDNRRCNIRLCSPQENHCNRHLNTNNTSGYKGVYWDKHKQRWQAQIKFQGQRMRLGRFKIKEDAAVAYNEAASRLFGSFALLNHITPL